MKKFVDIRIIKYLGKVVLIILLIVFILRQFFFELYTISTSQMESTLMGGDEVLVSKLSYGARLPITPLSIPFSFDRYYSSLIQLPYKRLFAKEIEKNDIVLFNSPLETENPIDKRSLLISRCIASPGDTILLKDGVYYINKKEYIHSPAQVDEYVVLLKNYSKLYATANQLYIDIHHLGDSNDSIYFAINRYDAAILKNSVRADLFFRKNYVIPQSLFFIVPSEGRKLALTANNIKIYRQIIMEEQKGRVLIEDDGLYINDEKAEIYTFQDDYYWMLSDNTVAGLDSRTLGFIPYRNVVGRGSTILYSRGKLGLRSDRFLKSVQ